MRIGRPRHELNLVQLPLLEQLSARGVSDDDAAELISELPDYTGRPGPSISGRTLRRNYGAVLQKGRAHARAALAAAQWSKALGGNVAMLIWLGKQYLGQRESPQVLTGMDGMPLVPAPIASAKTDVVVLLPDNGRDEQSGPISLEDLSRRYGFSAKPGNRRDLAP